MRAPDSLSCPEEASASKLAQELPVPVGGPVLSCLSGPGGLSCPVLYCPVCLALEGSWYPLTSPGNFFLRGGGSKGSGCRGRAEGTEAKAPKTICHGLLSSLHHHGLLSSLHHHGLQSSQLRHGLQSSQLRHGLLSSLHHHGLQSSQLRHGLLSSQLRHGLLSSLHHHGLQSSQLRHGLLSSLHHHGLQSSQLRHGLLSSLHHHGLLSSLHHHGLQSSQLRHGLRCLFRSGGPRPVFLSMSVLRGLQSAHPPPRWNCYGVGHAFWEGGVMSVLCRVCLVFPPLVSIFGLFPVLV